MAKRQHFDDPLPLGGTVVAYEQYRELHLDLGCITSTDGDNCM